MTDFQELPLIDDLPGTEVNVNSSMTQHLSFGNRPINVEVSTNETYDDKLQLLPSKKKDKTNFSFDGGKMESNNNLKLTEELNIFKTNIRRILLFSPTGSLQLNEISREYSELFMRPIPFKHFGYAQLKELLCRLPSVCMYERIGNKFQISKVSDINQTRETERISGNENQIILADVQMGVQERLKILNARDRKKVRKIMMIQSSQYIRNNNRDWRNKVKGEPAKDNTEAYRHEILSVLSIYGV